MNYPDTIQAFLRHVDGTVYGVCEAFYRGYLQNAPSDQAAAETLRYFFEHTVRVQTDSTLKAQQEIPEEELRAAIQKYRPIVHQLVENLVESRLEEEQFYQQLWQQLNNQAFFPNSVAVVAAIVVLFHNSQVPYYLLPEPPLMDDKDYRRCSEQIIQQLNRALFSINTHHAQKTQMAIQLIELYRQLPAEDERTVFVAHLLGYFQEKLNRLSRQLEETGKQKS